MWVRLLEAPDLERFVGRGGGVFHGMKSPTQVGERQEVVGRAERNGGSEVCADEERSGKFALWNYPGLEIGERALVHPVRSG
jgi:hypothetical protein